MSFYVHVLHFENILNLNLLSLSNKFGNRGRNYFCYILYKNTIQCIVFNKSETGQMVNCEIISSTAIIPHSISTTKNYIWFLIIWSCKIKAKEFKSITTELIQELLMEINKFVFTKVFLKAISIISIVNIIFMELHNNMNRK